MTIGLDDDADDIEMRIDRFGVNVIPQKPPPSFFQLAWEAFQDPLLIVLTGAAFLTIGLSFYKPPPDDARGKLTGRLKRDLGGNNKVSPTAGIFLADEAQGPGSEMLFDGVTSWQQK